ncbi:MAG: hypothetical protein M3R38_21875 [Actinomycetota bacterium]|nr:hypothetical protein [Actinomycetota bacterium]
MDGRDGARALGPALGVAIARGRKRREALDRHALPEVVAALDGADALQGAQGGAGALPVLAARE